MKSIKVIFLELLFERKDSLSYFQLLRKFKNKGLHSEVANLESIIEDLLKKELISYDSNKISDSKFYKITTKGIEVMQAAKAKR